MSSSQEIDDKYALHTAARESRLTVFERLIGAHPELSQRKDDDGRLPIHWAASSNQIAMDDSGWTPLMISASVKDGADVVDVLLRRGADVNQKNNNGQTALHLISSKSNLEVARTLFAHKPPASCRVRDKRGQYPLHRAAAVGSTPMVKLLIENGSPLNATDIAGYTALHHAIAEGHGKLSSSG
ncbi:ankyrin [Nemania serpens]|nr:ankyrin [Nemania serpens]